MTSRVSASFGAQEQQGQHRTAASRRRARAHARRRTPRAARGCGSPSRLRPESTPFRAITQRWAAMGDRCACRYRRRAILEPSMKFRRRDTMFRKHFRFRRMVLGSRVRGRRSAGGTRRRRVAFDLHRRGPRSREQHPRPQLHRRRICATTRWASRSRRARRSGLRTRRRQSTMTRVCRPTGCATPRWRSATSSCSRPSPSPSGASACQGPTRRSSRSSLSSTSSGFDWSGRRPRSLDGLRGGAAARASASSSLRRNQHTGLTSA